MTGQQESPTPTSRIVVRRTNGARRSNVVGQARPGDHVRLSWDWNTQVRFDILKRLWHVVSEAEDVQIVAGSPEQRCAIETFLLRRGMPVIVPPSVHDDLRLRCLTPSPASQPRPVRQQTPITAHCPAQVGDDNTQTRKTIAVRPRLARNKRRGGEWSHVTTVSSQAETGQHVALNWHSDVRTAPGPMAYVWDHINLAASVHVTGGRQRQREAVRAYLADRQMPVTILHRDTRDSR